MTHQGRSDTVSTLCIRNEGDNTMTNPLLELKALGQSVWLDDIDRAQLRSGLFGRLIDEDGLSGATGNPTIFEHAITHSATYDEQMQQLLREGKSSQEIYEALAMTDVRTVADMLRPTYDQMGGQDGFVSIEVSPYLAKDTEGTLAEVRRFWETIDRPNLMVKIPSTPAGVPAIRQALSEGININITLIFSLDNYRQVAEAYLSALEERSATGRDISRIASVASFFVSRVDALVDKLLEDRIKAVGDNIERQKLKTLEGKAAIANARLAYQEFKRLFSTPRFAALKQPTLISNTNRTPGNCKMRGYKSSRTPSTRCFSVLTTSERCFSLNEACKARRWLLWIQRTMFRKWNRRLSHSWMVCTLLGISAAFALTSMPRKMLAE